VNPALTFLAFTLSAQAAAQVGHPHSESGTRPPGVEKSVKTHALEAGAKVLQNNGPLGKFDVYIVGFHPMKEHPEQQLEAHHYCHQINEDFAQCVLFDGNTSRANMHGVEYIISERLFETLPAEERKFWHPHNAEILSGQLVAPGLPAPAEKAFMRSKLNSYGKTWHVWKTGHKGQADDALPIGMPMLAWSFNRDGEALPGLVEERDKKLRIDSMKKRKERADLVASAKPQSGVDDLKGKFSRPTRDIPGVRSIAPPR